MCTILYRVQKIQSYNNRRSKHTFVLQTRIAWLEGTSAANANASTLDRDSPAAFPPKGRVSHHSTSTAASPQVKRAQNPFPRGLDVTEPSNLYKVKYDYPAKNVRTHIPSLI
jgi:hypothetical protein